MKKSLFALLLAVSVISVTGCGTKDAANSITADTATAVTVTNTPTQAIEIVPTQVPLVDDGSLYPAYSIKDGDKKFGYINKTGTFVIEPKYFSATDFSDGIALVTDENGNKYIDTAGKVIYESSDDIYISSPFVNGAAVITKFNDTTTKYGYIDNQGKTLLEPIYDRASDFNKDGNAFVIVNGKYEKINKSGDIIDSYNVNKRYTNVLDFKDGYIIYEDPDTHTAGVIDYKGNIIITPSQNSGSYPVYNSILYLGNDLFGVGDSSKDYYSLVLRPYAIFDNKGEQITDYKFYDLTSFHNGYASATDDNYTYFINTKGETVTDLLKLSGNGTLTLNGDTIEASLDGDLIYMAKDGTVFWQAMKEKTLINGITVNSVKIKPSKFVTIYYPVLEGLSSQEVQDKVNQELKKLFVDSRKDVDKDDALSVEDSFQVEFLGNMLIINRIGYDYYFGAAHGMPIKDYYHIDLTTGDIYSLQDLFTEGKDYVSVINKIIKNYMDERKNNPNYMYFDNFSGISDNQYFYLTKDGIQIYFYPYDISPYAAGFPDFLISYDKLKDVINYDGPMWKAFHE